MGEPLEVIGADNAGWLRPLARVGWGNEVRAAAISPAGDRVALAGSGVMVLALPSLETIDTLWTERRADAVAFGPDGETLVYALAVPRLKQSAGSALLLHRLGALEPFAQIARGATDALHVDGAGRLWSVHGMGTSVHDLAEGRVFPLVGGRHLAAAAAAPRVALGFAVGAEPRVRIYGEDLRRTHEVVLPPWAALPGVGLSALGLSPDGGHVAIASRRHLWICDLSGTGRVRFEGETAAVRGLAFDAHDHLLVISDRLRWLDLDGRTRGEHAWPHGSVVRVEARPGDGWLVVTTHPAAVRLLDADGAVVAERRFGRRAAEALTLRDPPPHARGEALLEAVTLGRPVRADGISARAATGEHTVKVMDETVRPSGDIVVTTPEGSRCIARAHDQNIVALALDGPGRTLASVGNDRKLVLWEVATGARLASLGRVDADRILCFGDGVLLGPGPGAPTLWCLREHRALASLDGVPDPTCGAFHPGGQLAAVGTSRGGVELFTVPGGRHVGHAYGLTDCVRGVAFSPDGRLLGATGDDGTTRLWGLPPEPPQGPEGPGVWGRIGGLEQGFPPVHDDWALALPDRTPPPPRAKKPEKEARCTPVHIPRGLHFRRNEGGARSEALFAAMGPDGGDYATVERLLRAGESANARDAEGRGLVEALWAGVSCSSGAEAARRVEALLRQHGYRPPETDPKPPRRR